MRQARAMLAVAVAALVGACEPASSPVAATRPSDHGSPAAVELPYLALAESPWPKALTEEARIHARKLRQRVADGEVDFPSLRDHALADPESERGKQFLEVLERIPGWNESMAGEACAAGRCIPEDR